MADKLDGILRYDEFIIGMDNNLSKIRQEDLRIFSEAAFITDHTGSYLGREGQEIRAEDGSLSIESTWAFADELDKQRVYSHSISTKIAISYSGNLVFSAVLLMHFKDGKRRPGYDGDFNYFRRYLKDDGREWIDTLHNRVSNIMGAASL